VFSIFSGGASGHEGRVLPTHRGRRPCVLTGPVGELLGKAVLRGLLGKAVLRGLLGKAVLRGLLGKAVLREFEEKPPTVCDGDNPIAPPQPTETTRLTAHPWSRSRKRY